MAVEMRRHSNSKIAQMDSVARDRSHWFHFCPGEGNLQYWWLEADESQELGMHSDYLDDNRSERFVGGLIP